MSECIKDILASGERNCTLACLAGIRLSARAGPDRLPTQDFLRCVSEIVLSSKQQLAYVTRHLENQLYSVRFRN
eukprot:IDg11246t1